jgi:hypothetical protein
MAFYEGVVGEQRKKVNCAMQIGGSKGVVCATIDIHPNGTCTAKHRWSGSRRKTVPYVPLPSMFVRNAHIAEEMLKFVECAQIVQL